MNEEEMEFGIVDEDIEEAGAGRTGKTGKYDEE